MRIKRVHFRGFGRWVDHTFTFQPGLNLIEAPNEAGKSTLIKGLTAMLYGGKKEGVSRRQREDWVDSYRPWTGKEYGGEIDFSLGEKEYRIVRSLDWDDEKEQLVDLKTGRDLTGEFMMDRRKDRGFAEGLLGLPRSLFNRVFYLSSQSMQGDHQVVDKVRQLITQGEEMDLKPVLEDLKRDIQEIGKTAHARNKPYGAAVTRLRELEQEVIQLRSTYRGLREDQARLAQFQLELKELTAEWEESRNKVSQLRTETRRAERREALEEKRKHVQYRIARWQDAKDKVIRLEQEKANHMPPHLLDVDEIADLSRLIEEHHSPEDKLEELENRIRDLKDELTHWQEKKRWLLDIDEEALQRHRHQLEEARRLKENLLAPAAKETVDDRVRAMQLEKDHRSLTDLQEQEEVCRNRRREKEDEISRLRYRLDRIEKEQFLTKVVDSQIPPARSSFVWLWIATGALLLSAFLLTTVLPLGIFSILFAGFSLYRFKRLRQVDKQVRQEWDEQQEELQEDLHRLRREREQDGDQEADVDTLRRLKDEKNSQLQKIYDELALVMQQQEQILNRWKASSATDLHRHLDKQRQKVQERESARKADELNRLRIKEIKREVQEWATPFADRLGSFDIKAWTEELGVLAKEVENARDGQQRMKLEITSLDKEVERIHEKAKRHTEEMKKWSAYLGTEDVELWSSWILQSNQVHQLDVLLGEARNELEQLQQQKQSEKWEEQLKETEQELGELMDEGEDNLIPAEQWRIRLQRAEGDLETVELSQRSKESEVMKLEERLKTEFDRLPPLADRETLFCEAQNEVKELETERAALETVREVLQEALSEVQEDIAPKLKPHASHWIRHVTGGRYDHLLIDPTDGLQLSVFVPETGERQPVERLSRGTIDQMYFALRLALVRFFSENGPSPLPLILDDSLVHFDQGRLREAVRILGELSSQHQIILCTCQTRERAVLEEEGISFFHQKISTHMEN
ncbi:AAA family ATPase [Kroppenstedtia pulmonis]|uniref:AAA family ATPase n=1 Tax=Kroppenstedtia pulmonis TaxID=1380685 RepID=A0A7D3XQV4_9BACL|nr:AAA family ATPase [Kroppenstedtia pulmonis]QKG85107.1 AAA family ATPase [Kroppenstedtia pulmonis]